jgi:hypothetical protein
MFLISKIKINLTNLGGGGSFLPAITITFRGICGSGDGGFSRKIIGGNGSGSGGICLIIKGGGGICNDESLIS